MKPRAIFFDLDNTLIESPDNTEAVARVSQELSARMGMAASRIETANADAFRAFWPEGEEHWTLGRMTGRDVMREVWRRALAACDSDDEALIGYAVASHAEYAHKSLRCFTDAIPALESLAPLPLALITNGASDTQRGNLKHLALDRFFAAIVVSGEIGVAKPGKAPFEHALEMLHLQPREAWHVGDNIINDVLGAQNAGIKAVWLNRDGKGRNEEGPVPDWEIASLKKLAGLVDAS